MESRVKNITKCIKEIFKKPEYSGTSFRYRDILFFVKFVKPLWKLGLISLTLTFISTGLGSLLPLSSKVLIDFIIMKKGFYKVENLLTSLNLEYLIPFSKHFLESLNLVILSILIIGMVIGLIGIIQRYIIFKFQQELTFNIQTKLFEQILRFPMSFFKRKQTGYLVSRVSDDVDALQNLFSQSLPQIATSLFYIFFGIAILFMLSIKLSLIAISILPAYVFINYYFGRRLREVSLDEREKSSQVSKDFQEVFSGVEVIKAYTGEEKEVQKVSSKMRSVIQTRIKGIILSLSSNYSAKGVQLISTLLIMWFGVKEILNNALTIGDYVAFNTYILYLSSSINRVSLFHIFLQPIFASLERLKEMFKIIPEIDYEETVKPSPITDGIKGEIKFKNVFFHYEENRRVLENISFTAHPGEITALVGPSGSGKTTLVNLILKFHVPQSGIVFLDGVDLNKIPAKWLREKIAVVSQEVFLFNDTIERNIKYGRPDATKEEVIAAAKKANIHWDIENLPNSYDTEVGERGIKLSSGQRQRISIARAFLKNPPILIFDEPTSALDSKTERLVKDSIKELSVNKTTLIIAHHPSLVEIANKILFLNKGRIINTKTQ